MFLHHTNDYAPHFLWLYMGWPTKLIIHKPLVTLATLFKNIFVYFTVQRTYNSTTKLCIATIMM